MAKKTDNNGSKISGVDGLRGSHQIERLSGVESVEKTQKASAVSAVKRVGAAGRTGSISAITAANREAIYQMLHEEADKLFSKGSLSKDKREVVERAVKMAIDAVIVDEENNDKKDKTKEK